MKKGLTLIEIIMAMAIMVVGIIGVVRLLPVGLKTSQSAEMLSKAAFLAQEKIEEFKLSGLDALIAGSVSLSGEQGQYSWQASLEEAELEGVVNPEGARRLNLEISWLEKEKLRSQEFVTFLGR